MQRICSVLLCSGLPRARSIYTPGFPGTQHDARVLQVDCADGCKFTPLHSAASGGHVAAIKKLVALGHPVGVLDYVGEVP